MLINKYQIGDEWFLKIKVFSTVKRLYIEFFLINLFSSFYTKLYNSYAELCVSGDYVSALNINKPLTMPKYFKKNFDLNLNAHKSQSRWNKRTTWF